MSDYSVYPYVGCTHACRYCYVSFMKRFTGHTEPWGTFLDVKHWPEILHPGRPVNTLTIEEWNRLASLIPERLAFFIEKNKTTPEEYLASKSQDYRNTLFYRPMDIAANLA